MSNYEDRTANTENRGARLPRYDRQQCSQITLTNIFKDINEEKLGKKMAQHNHTHKFAEQGIKARFNKQALVDISLLKEAEQEAYFRGYYEDGNRLLALAIDCNKIPERVMKILEDKNITLEAFLEYTGYYDGKDPNIVFEQLPQAIQNSIIYQDGYNRGYEQKKVGRK